MEKSHKRFLGISAGVAAAFLIGRAACDKEDAKPAIPLFPHATPDLPDAGKLVEVTFDDAGIPKARLRMPPPPPPLPPRPDLDFDAHQEFPLADPVGDLRASMRYLKHLVGCIDTARAAETECGSAQLGIPECDMRPCQVTPENPMGGPVACKESVRAKCLEVLRALPQSERKPCDDVFKGVAHSCDLDFAQSAPDSHHTQIQKMAVRIASIHEAVENDTLIPPGEVEDFINNVYLAFGDVSVPQTEHFLAASRKAGLSPSELRTLIETIVSDYLPYMPNADIAIDYPLNRLGFVKVGEEWQWQNIPEALQ